MPQFDDQGERLTGDVEDLRVSLVPSRAIVPTTPRMWESHSSRILRFGLVGVSGVVVNTGALYVLTNFGHLFYLLAAIIATEVAIVTNFILNDRWTFGDTHRHVAWAQRFVRYNAICVVGMGISVGVLALLTSVFGVYYLVANLFAIAAATVWNYAINTRFTWIDRAVASADRGVREGLRGRLKAWHVTSPVVARCTAVALIGVLLGAVFLSLAWILTANPGTWTVHAAVFLAGAHDTPTGIAAGTAVLWRHIVQPDTARKTHNEDEPLFVALRRFVEATYAARAKVASQIARVVIIGAVLWIILAQPNAWVALGTLILGVALITPAHLSRRQTVTVLLAAVVGVSSVNYLTWRLGVINWSSWWIAVPLFLAELLGGLHTLGFQYTLWPRRAPEIDAQEDPTLRPIFVFVPTVNEGAAILDPTIRAALAARKKYLEAHPHGHVEIVICNDGFVANYPQWREAETLAQELGVTCVTRTIGGGAKAGNIESARHFVGATGDALMVIFDADQIARDNFLLETVPPFADPTIAWVQTGQYYSNLDNPVARWANDQQAIFYRVLCPGKAAVNAAFICGTNVVLRAAALDEIGGLPQDSVTEDFAASINLHERWRSIYLPDVLATGLGPMDLRSYFRQQGRWATGTLGVLRSHWQRIFMPGRGGLTFNQRVQYALACTHYLSGVRDLIYIIAPVVFLLTGITSVRGSNLPTFLQYFLPYWLASQVAFWYVAWGKASLRGIVIGFGSFPVLISCLPTVILGRKVGFAVTSKRRENDQTWRALLPHIVAMAACVIGVVFGFALHAGRGPAIVSTLWVAYTMILLGSTIALGGMLWLGLRDWRVGRGAGRAPRTARPQIRTSLASRVGFGAVAALLIVTIVGTSTIQAFAPRTPPPVAFAPRQETGVANLGLTLPTSSLRTKPATLAQDYGLTFGIIGRTQTIGDTFDRAWADGLSSTGTRPWVTLEFDTADTAAGPENLAALESSLPSIYNGLHDEALRRWAREMRDYRQPVYFTMLLHMDRDWSVSSAVTRGGIPQDSARAWQHARAIFRSEGATNVAWVWAPADPAHDQEYAPPPDAIDAVLRSFINFPDDREWPDPMPALREVTTRYPDMPLLVEVSAAGTPERKSAWLRQVGAAVTTLRNTYAVLYKEGSPSLHATEAEDAAWSFTSDALSTQATLDLVSLLQRSMKREVVSRSPVGTPTPTIGPLHSPMQTALPARMEQPRGKANGSRRRRRNVRSYRVRRRDRSRPTRAFGCSQATMAQTEGQ